jgi:hypothetical protein
MANVTNQLIDDAVEKVKSTLSRSIVTKLVPFLSLVLVPVAAWAQDKVGINLDPTALAVFVGTSIIGLAGAAATYVRSRLNGIYALHSTLIDKGVDVYNRGAEDYKAVK